MKSHTKRGLKQDRREVAVNEPWEPKYVVKKMQEQGITISEDEVKAIIKEVGHYRDKIEAVIKERHNAESNPAA